MKIIGITGKKRVGKNYVADLATELYEKNFGFVVRQMAFAEPLKEVCKIMFGLTDADLAGDKTGPCWERWEEVNEEFNPYEPPKTGPLTVRELLQHVGTDLFRNCWSKTIWTRIAARRIEEAEAAGVDVVIFTDVRFPNEAATIEAMGGEIWKIVGKARGELGTDTHESENHVIEGLRLVNDEKVAEHVEDLLV